MFAYPWYHCTVDRSKAEKLLTAANKVTFNTCPSVTASLCLELPWFFFLEYAEIQCTWTSTLRPPPPFSLSLSLSLSFSLSICTALSLWFLSALCHLSLSASAFSLSICTALSLSLSLSLSLICTLPNLAVYQWATLCNVYSHNSCSFQDGMFLIRKSTRTGTDQKFTLMIYNQQKVYNLPVRCVGHDQYVLGKHRQNELVTLSFRIF